MPGALVQLGLKKDSNITPLDGYYSLYWAEITQEINSLVDATFLLRSNSPEFVEKVLRDLMDTGNPTLYYRLGESGQKSPIWQPWQPVHLTGFTADPHAPGLGHDVKIIAADLLCKLRHDEHVKAHKGYVHEIVAALAESYGLAFEVEPTQGYGIYVQSYISDYRFIVDRLLPRAINAKGSGNYRFFLRDGVLHFHTADYAAKLKEFVYFGSGKGVRLTEVDNSQQVALKGLLTKVVVYDQYSGTFKEVDPDPEKSLKFAENLPKIEDTDFITYHLGSNRSGEEFHLAQSMYDKRRAEMFCLKLIAENTTSVQLNDLLNLTVLADRAKNSQWSGIYSVNKVKHIYEQGALSSSFTLQRGELQAQANAISGDSQLNTPGRGLNLATLNNTSR